MLRADESEQENESRNVASTARTTMIRRLLLVGIALALVGAAVIGVLAHRAYEQAHALYKGYEDEETFFTVARGESGIQVANGLEDAGIIVDARLFVAALRLRGDAAGIQAGEYRFGEELSTIDVLERLVAGDIYTFAVTIPEGLTLTETADHLSVQGLGEVEGLAQAFADPAPISDLDPDATNLEGYVFPTTYHFTRNPEPDEVAQTMVNQFKEIFDERRKAKSEELGLTMREVVTLASIIEKETGDASERPLIGSVFWNRLDRGMTLGSDPTIIYALKLAGTFDGNLRRADLELDSPYNTYRYAGLPPGPIASPGAESIDAVLEPAESSFLYFVSKNDGTHYFSRSLREHNNAVRKYQVEYFRRRRQQEQQKKNGAGSS